MGVFGKKTVNGSNVKERTANVKERIGNVNLRNKSRPVRKKIIGESVRLAHTRNWTYIGKVLLVKPKKGVLKSKNLQKFTNICKCAKIT